MSFPLLGGRGRGFQINPPPDHITRPTAALVKRRLFDWRQDWTGEFFVDLCSGSGSMGLEALSRGAQGVWLNEMNRTAFQCIQKNIIKWKEQQGLEEQTLELTQKDFRQFLETFNAKGWPFPQEKGVIFFDPPWEEHRLYDVFWKAIQGFKGEIWVASDVQKGIPLSIARQHLTTEIKVIEQGSHWVLVGKL